MKLNDFLKKLDELYNLPNIYKLGGFFNKKNKEKYECDCSGMIKACFWNYPKNGKYQSNNLKDMNANTMIKNCNDVSTDFKKIKKGCLVWLEGHIGVYLGNGIVQECSPRWGGKIQKTYCVGSPFSNKNKLNERKWVKYGYFKFINYMTNIQYLKYVGKSNSIVDILKSLKIDSSFSNRKKIAKKNGIENYTKENSYDNNIKLVKLAKSGKLKI